MLNQKEKQLEEFIERYTTTHEDVFNDMILLIASDVVGISYSYVHNREDAKDIAQEVFIKLYNKLGTFRRSAKVSTWIYRVTINASIDFLRKRRNTVFFNEALGSPVQETKETIRRLEQKDTHALLKEHINKLPLRQKNAIILKHFQGLTIREVSSILGCSQSSIKTHLVRGVRNLKKMIGEVLYE